MFEYKVCDMRLVSSSFLHFHLVFAFLNVISFSKWLLITCSPSSCGNVNFAFRGVCNRCGSARPTGASGGGAGGGGRGRGRGVDSGGRGGPVGAPTGGLFGPNDWPCPM